MTLQITAAVRGWRPAALAIALAAALGACTPGKFDFAIIGDTPYTRAQEAEYARVLEDLNKRDLGFVTHIGDFQFDARPYNSDPSRAAMPCADETYQDILNSFQSSRNPFVMTPGDNDWSDCAPLTARKIDVYERLDKIRSMFYPAGRSLGQRTMPVVSQSSDPVHGKFRENLRWSLNNVTFVTLHTVGNNDNVGTDPVANAEQAARMAANIAWLRTAFAQAKADRSIGLVIMTQANVGFENHWPAGQLGRYFRNFLGVTRPERPRPMAYDALIRAMSEEMETYDKPTAFYHGDSHIFRLDMPLFSLKTGRLFENFTRVETFGWPDSHWIRVTVDPSDPALFTSRAQIVPGNILNRK